MPAGADRRARHAKIKSGDAVKDRDGDTVGVVRQLRFDERTGEIRGLVLDTGGGLGRLAGGGEVAEVPRQQMGRVSDGVVRAGLASSIVATGSGAVCM